MSDLVLDSSGDLVETDDHRTYLENLESLAKALSVGSVANAWRMPVFAVGSDDESLYSPTPNDPGLSGRPLHMEDFPLFWWGKLRWVKLAPPAPTKSVVFTFIVGETPDRDRIVVKSPVKSPVCECGSTACGSSKHSDWCPCCT